MWPQIARNRRFEGQTQRSDVARKKSPPHCSPAPGDYRLAVTRASLVRRFALEIQDHPLLDLILELRSRRDSFFFSALFAAPIWSAFAHVSTKMCMSLVENRILFWTCAEQTNRRVYGCVSG